MSVNTLSNALNEVIDSVQDAINDPLPLMEIENEIQKLLESVPIEELRSILAELMQSPGSAENVKACPAGFIKIKGVCVPILSLLRFLGVAEEV